VLITDNDNSVFSVCSLPVINRQPNVEYFAVWHAAVSAGKQLLPADEAAIF